MVSKLSLELALQCSVEGDMTAKCIDQVRGVSSGHQSRMRAISNIITILDVDIIVVRGPTGDFLSIPTARQLEKQIIGGESAAAVYNDIPLVIRQQRKTAICYAMR
jgi:hypothetical protein